MRFRHCEFTIAADCLSESFFRRVNSNPSFLSQIGALIGVFAGLTGALIAGICAFLAHCLRHLFGRRDPIRVVRDPGDSQEWRKGNGTNSPIPARTK